MITGRIFINSAPTIMPRSTHCQGTSSLLGSSGGLGASCWGGSSSLWYGLSSITRLYFILTFI